MAKIVVPIKGMHCTSCSMLIEESLREVPGVKSARVSFRKKEAEIHTAQQVDMADIKAAVIKAGYSVGSEAPKEWFSRDLRKYDEIMVLLAIVVVAYLVLKQTGLFNINFTQGSSPSGLAVVLLVGLTAGFSTCMAMVGGLVLGIAARHSELHHEATPAQKFRPHIFFNIGRVGAYFVLGGGVGLLGKAFQLSGSMLGLLTVAVGAVMLLVGAQLTEISPRLSGIRLTLPAGVAKTFGIKQRHDREYSHVNSVISGALTFFLPCGFTQAMQLYALSTGSFLAGGLIMATFAIGTLPGLLGIAGITSYIKGVWANRFFKVAGLVVIMLAVFNISNGLTLLGWRFDASVFNRSNGVAAQIGAPTVPQDGVQVVRMNQLVNGYDPNSFTVKRGVPVRWIINSQSSQSCASSIYATSLGISKSLTPGENIIEFTPQQTGRIQFTCSMGMYRGWFDVVD